MAQRIAALMALILSLAPLSGCSPETRRASEQAYQPASGDIVFQISRSGQSVAIQLATKSPYSHMGIVYVQEGRAMVFEAVEPVGVIPLDRWVARGEGGHFVAKRLVDADQVLTPETLARMQAVGKDFEGLPYDLYFEWSDDRIYCSELVWKIYRRGAGLEIGELQTLGDFDLSPGPVQAKLRERWSGQPPLGEMVISPAAMFASELLVEIHRAGEGP